MVVRPITTVITLLTMSQGETIVDLGSGGGIDVLLAARKVGDQGRAIGVDMTEVVTPFHLYPTTAANTLHPTGYDKPRAQERKVRRTDECRVHQVHHHIDSARGLQRRLYNQ